eukprot:6856229-Alexandrium_andersonii.AAC.1
MSVDSDGSGAGGHLLLLARARAVAAPRRLPLAPWSWCCAEPSLRQLLLRSAIRAQPATATEARAERVRQVRQVCELVLGQEPR